MCFYSQKIGEKQVLENLIYLKTFLHKTEAFQLKVFISNKVIWAVYKQLLILVMLGNKGTCAIFIFYENRVCYEILLGEGLYKARGKNNREKICTSFDPERQKWSHLHHSLAILDQMNKDLASAVWDNIASHSRMQVGIACSNGPSEDRPYNTKYLPQAIRFKEVPLLLSPIPTSCIASKPRRIRIL